MNHNFCFHDYSFPTHSFCADCVLIDVLDLEMISPDLSAVYKFIEPLLLEETNYCSILSVYYKILIRKLFSKFVLDCGVSFVQLRYTIYFLERLGMKNYAGELLLFI